MAGPIRMGGTAGMPDMPGIPDIASAIIEARKVHHIFADRNHSTTHLANQTSDVESERWVVIVDTVILSLTLIGSFFIIGMMLMNELRGRAATTRMRLVQSLVLSDVAMGITGLIGCALDLSGTPLQVDTVSCDGLGVTFAAVIFTQHIWTLALAFATYMILIHPLHPVTSWIEKYWYYSWGVVWTISFGVSVTGYYLYGYEPSGGICYFTNNSGLFGELLQFLPRAVVFICIALLYGRLYVFLHRPDKIRSHNSSHGSGSGSWSHPRKASWVHPGGGSGGGKWGAIASRWFNPNGHKTVVIGPNGSRISSDDGAGAFKSSQSHSQSTQSANSLPSHHSNTSNQSIPKPIPPPLKRIGAKEKLHEKLQGKLSPRGAAPAADIPPWERIELPVFEVDGQKYGGASAGLSSAVAPATGKDKENLWGDWRGLGGRRQRSSVVPDVPRGGAPGAHASPKSSPTRPGFDMSEGNTATPQLHPSSPASDRNDPSSPSGATVVELSDSIPSPSRGGQLDSSEHLSSPVCTPLSEDRRPSIPVSAMSGPSDGTATVIATGAQTPEHTDKLGFPDLEKGTDGYPADDKDIISYDFAAEGGAKDDDDDDFDLMKFLKEDGSSETGDDHTHTRASSHTEYVPESMASYLNRKTALLLLWFPLGYVLLFMTSFIRTIYDFVGHPPVELRAISRWMIFGQGLLDAFIYGIVEFHTKRVVRKKVRKGTLSPRTSQRTSGNGKGHKTSGLRGFTSSWRPTASQQQQAVTPTASQVRATSPEPTASKLAGGSPTVSFAEPEPSILQRLDMRKGSAATEGSLGDRELLDVPEQQVVRG